MAPEPPVAARPKPQAQRPVAVELGGLLGQAIDASRRGRLSRFIVDETSPAIALFDEERSRSNLEGDWYGEHAGKWLIAAARAAARTPDAALAATVKRVAEHLIGLQRSDGYLGNYAPERRFMVRQPPEPPEPPKHPSWDGAPALRTWDIWTHAYMILGLLEVHKQLGHPGCLAAARRIGDLCWHALDSDGINITALGNHHGLSATVLMDPAMELYFATGDARYLDLALRVLQQADAHPECGLLRRALAGADAAEIATGKAYQLAWNLVGLAKIHKATGAAEHARALDHLWHSIREHHLSLGGGPWGGVGHRSREVFNAPGTFSPLAYIETCSTLAWIQLNRQLLEISGDPRYADEIECSAYNDLLGAMAANGEDWCYYSFPNGRRVHTTAWRCCKSSGAMALEELPLAAFSTPPSGGVRINLLGPSRLTLALPAAGSVTLELRTRYPFDGQIALYVTPERTARFELGLRIPGWAEAASVQVNDQALDPARDQAARPGSYHLIERLWQPGDCVRIELPMPAVMHRKVLRNVQESRAPDGSPVRQEVLHHEYLAITRGPLVYATGLIDGFKTEETIALPPGPSEGRLENGLENGLAGWLEVLPTAIDTGPAIRLRPLGRGPLDFHPYYRADGRIDGGWRITWLSLAPTSSNIP